MAVSSTPSTVLTVDEYLLSAFQKAGLLPIEAEIGFDASWTSKAGYGRKVLNRLIEELATEGFIDHFVAFEILTLTADDGLYTLDTDILNVVDTANYIPASNAAEVEETTGETPISPMSRFQWGQLSSKSATGTPSKYFLHRNGSSLEIHFWPIPSEAGSVRLHVHRIPGSNSAGSDNVDLKRHWGTWIVHALAYEFMVDAKLPIDERATMRNDRDRAMQKIKTYETSNEPPDVRFVHSTPWSGF